MLGLGFRAEMSTPYSVANFHRHWREVLVLWHLAQKYDPIYTSVIFSEILTNSHQNFPFAKRTFKGNKKIKECAWKAWKNRRKTHIKKSYKVFCRGFFLLLVWWCFSFFFFFGWVILFCLVGLFFQMRSWKRIAA